MTPNTLDRRFAIFFFRLMAGFAFPPNVIATQYEIRCGVIETQGVEAGDVGVPALVFGMAAFAQHRSAFFQPPMKAALLRDIVGDVRVIVAGQALLCLTFFTKPLVAKVTIRFD